MRFLWERGEGEDEVLVVATARMRTGATARMRARARMRMGARVLVKTLFVCTLRLCQSRRSVLIPSRLFCEARERLFHGR